MQHERVLFFIIVSFVGITFGMVPQATALHHHRLSDKPFLSSVRLNVYEGKYIYLITGYPGNILKYKLDFQSSEILIHTSLAFSQTVSPIDAVSGEGNDKFYFAEHELRLPFRQAAPTDTLFFNNYKGTLGLGRASPLWRYWGNYTLSRDRLKLGMFDRYASEDPYWLGPQIGFDLEGKTKCQIFGKEYDFAINMGRIETLVPDEVFHEHKKTLNALAGGGGGEKTSEQHTPDREQIHVQLVPKYKNCTEHYAAWGLDAEEWAVKRCENYQTIVLLTGDVEQPDGKMIFSTLKHVIGGTRFELGKSALDDIVIFFNMQTNDILLAPFALNVSHIEFLWIICLLTFLLTILWIIGVDVGSIGDPTAHLLILLANIFLYSISILLFITNWIGFEVNQFLSNLISDDGAVFVILIGIITFSFPLLNIAIIFFNRSRWSSRPRTQKLLLLNVVFYNMWLSMVESQQTATDLIYMLILSSTIAIITTTLTILIFLSRNRKSGGGGEGEELWSISFLGIVLIAFSYTVLIRCNLIPMLQMIFVHFKPAIIIIYMVFFIVIPSLYFVTILKILLIEKRLSPPPTATPQK